MIKPCKAQLDGWNNNNDLCRSLCLEELVEDQPYKFAQYKDDEDIEDFLETFENMMRLNDYPEDGWVVQLVPFLQGKTCSACAGLDYTDYHMKRSKRH